MQNKSDNSQIWWGNSLVAFPGLIHFWPFTAEFPQFPGLQFIEQFLCIYGETAGQIELKFSEQTLWSHPSLMHFDLAPFYSRRFLACDWLSSFRAFAAKELIRFSSNLVSKLIADLPWRH